MPTELSQAAGLQRQIEQLTRSRDGYAELSVKLQAELERQAMAGESLPASVPGDDAALGRLNAELDKARAAAKLAQKLQMLREADLEDLQQQFREVRAEQLRQRQLFAELAERLRMALEVFRRMGERPAAAPSRRIVLSRPAADKPEEG